MDSPETWNLIPSNNLADFWFVEVFEDGTTGGLIDGAALYGYPKDEWSDGYPNDKWGRLRLLNHLIGERLAEVREQQESIKKVEESGK